ESVDSPVGPIAGRVARDHEVPGADVPSTVAFVEHRHRQLEDVHLVASEDHFLAGSGLYLDRWNQLLLPALVFAVDLLHGGVRLEPERERHPPPRPDPVHEDAVLFRVIRDALEPDRRTVALAREPADRSKLEVPTDLVVDLHQIARRAKSLDEFAIVLPDHRRLLLAG